MVVSIPVIPHGGALSHRLGIRQGEGQVLCAGIGRREEDLQGVERLPQISAAGGSHILQRPFLCRYREAGR